MNDTGPSIKSQILSAIIEWGIPLLLSSSALLTYLDVVADFFRSVVGWKWVVLFIAFIVFWLSRFFILWQRERKNNRILSKKLSEDFHIYLKPVPSKGYCIDTRFNEPVCPNCAATGVESFLKIVRQPKGCEFNDNVFCGVCRFHIEL